MIDIYSWNVNGIRACIKKGFKTWLEDISPDILCIQETRADNEIFFDQVEDISKYNIYNNCKIKGYSGVSIFSKVKPGKIIYKTGLDIIDNEGRFILAEYENFSIINIYFPNSQKDLQRLDLKILFNKEILKYLNEYKKKKKKIILCGDFNVAHKAIDLKNPKMNEKNPGYTVEEREGMDNFINNGYLDSFRIFNKEPENYTWWSYRFNARKRNIGWRIDYFLVNLEVKNNLKSSLIHPYIYGSDHCPISVTIDS